MKRHSANGIMTITALYEVEAGAEVKVGGIIICIKEMTDDSKRRMAVIEIEDDEDRVEVAVSPEAYEQWSSFIEYDAMVVVSGKLGSKEDESVVLADTIWPMSPEPQG